MRSLIFIAVITLFTACAPKGADDPLKNTKKLIIKGHTSLYQNGMLEIPFTKVHFIPSVTGSLDLASGLFYEDARNALQQSLQEAVASVYIIPQGSQKAYEVSKDLFRASNKLSDRIRQFTRGSGVWLVDRSSQFAKDHIVGAFQGAKNFAQRIYQKGDDIEAFFDQGSRDILAFHWKGSQKIFKGALKGAKEISKQSARLASKHFQLGKDAFIQGYVALPQKLSDNYKKVGKRIDENGFAQAAKDAWALREKGSVYFQEIFSDTLSDYSEDVSKSFSKATQDFGKRVQKEGVLLTSLKSMGWLLKGLVYDGVIKPVAKLAGSTIGLVTVNGIIYPVHYIAGEAKATTMVMVEVTVQTAQSIYDIVAPSMHFALASLLSSSEYIGGKLLAGSTATLGTAVSGVGATTGVAFAGLSKATGVVVGKGTKYVGVPIAVSAKAVGEVSYGVVASTGSLALGGATLVTGEGAALATQVTGTALSGTTLVGGTGYSVGKAGVKGVYSLAKAVVLPTGYTLSSGMVLGYSSLTQLQAHTLLAASDAMYMILSLEGPKWVLYTVTGQTYKRDQALPAGVIVDLKKMQEDNRTIKRIEVTDEELQNVLKSVQKDLPLLQ